MSKTVLFQTVQFSINTQFSSIWPIDRTLSGVTTLGQSRPGSNCNEGVLHISQSSSITGASPSDCLVSFSGHSLDESYPSAEKQSVYSRATANRATSALWQNLKYLSVFLLSFIFMLWSIEWQNQLNDKFFSFCWLTVILMFWPGWDDPFANFMYHIFLDSFWFMHIPFVSMVKI